MPETTNPRHGWAKTTVVLLTSNVLRNIGLILILVLLARFTDQKTVGQYTLSLAITAPLFVFGQFGMRNVYLTLRKRVLFNTYTQVQAAMLLLALASSLILAVLVAPDLIITVILVGSVKIADSAAEFFAGPLQKFGRIWLILSASFITAAVGSIVTGLTLARTGDLNLTLTVLALSSLTLTAVLLWIPAARVARDNEGTNKSKVSKDSIKLILASGFPIGSAGAILALVSSTPQLFLSSAVDRSAVGHFAVLLYIYALVDIFTTTMIQAWLPHAKTRAELNSNLGDFFNFCVAAALRITLIFVPLSVIGLALAVPLIPAIFGEDYDLNMDAAAPLCFALIALPAAHFGNGGLLTLNYYKHSITVSVVAALASLASCIILIPAMGLPGALWSCMIATTARGIASFVILKVKTRNLEYKDDPETLL